MLAVAVIFVMTSEPGMVLCLLTRVIALGFSILGARLWLPRRQRRSMALWRQGHINPARIAASSLRSSAAYACNRPTGDLLNHSDTPQRRPV